MLFISLWIFGETVLVFKVRAQMAEQRLEMNSDAKPLQSQFMNCMTHVLQESCCAPGEFVAVGAVASPRLSPLGSIESSVLSLDTGLDREFLFGHCSGQPALLLSPCCQSPGSASPG